MVDHDDELASYTRPGFRADLDTERLRVPPQAIEAEQAVLGGLMLSGLTDGRAWFDVCDVLQEVDFYRRDHQLIWRAIKELAGKQQPFDSLTLGDWFQARGEAELVGGGVYLVELSATTPSAANIRAYAEIVAEKARLRRLIEVGTELVNAGFQPEGRSSLEIVGSAQTRVGSILDSQPCDLEPVAPVMQRVFERLQQRFAGEPEAKGLPLPIDELDALLNGLKPGGLYVLAARPKMGKTTLARNIAEHCALVVGKPAAVFSFEMQPEELGDLMLSSVGDIDSDRIRRGDLEDDDWARVTDAMRRLRGAQILVSRPRSARVEHVVAQARRQHARTPLGLVVIDYLQLMQTSGDNRAQGLGDVTRALKLMAGELRVPVLLLSQLNRDLEKRPDKRPVPADLRDSGAIEQDADAVLFIYRDEYYNRHSPDAGTAELIVALQRNGPTGTVRAAYRPDRSRFENLPFGWEPKHPTEVDGKPRARGFRARRARPDVAAAAAGDVA